MQNSAMGSPPTSGTGRRLPILILRIVARSCWALAVVIIVAVLGWAFYREQAPATGGLVFAIILALAGVVLQRATAVFRDPDVPDMGLAGYLAFGSAGLAMVAGGIAIAFVEPGGIALAVFGVVFLGVAHLSRRVFSAAPGKRRIVVESAGVALAHGDSATEEHRQGVTIEVPEDADDAAIAAARQAWLNDKWAARPGWASGRIPENAQTISNMLPRDVLIVMTVIGLIGAVCAWWIHPLFLALTAYCVVGAGVAIHKSMQATAHGRLFGPSTLELEVTPVHPGGTLRGRVETGVRPQDAPEQGFEVEVSCRYRWDETDISGSRRSTRLRVETLWSTKVRATGSPAPSGTHLIVDLDLPLPGDKPGASLAGRRQGVHWELALRADVPEMDYLATFPLPILASDVRIASKR
ncbi:MAG: hypothetical protein JJT88_08545 [Gammaproteobacteria bacterium]|nr:hypothetical protein [Gammaproteobacteria bacterium]